MTTANEYVQQHIDTQLTDEYLLSMLSRIDLFRQILNRERIPQVSSGDIEYIPSITQLEEPLSFQRVIDLCKEVAIRSPNFRDPRRLDNIIPSANNVAIYAGLLALMVNSNVVNWEYSYDSYLLEKHMVKQISTLLGISINQSWGLYVSGGTMSNLYDCLFAIRRSFPDTVRQGIAAMGTNYKIILGSNSHYSARTTLNTLGINTEANIDQIRTVDDQIDITSFQQSIIDNYNKGIKVILVFITMGTTNNFGIDPLNEILVFMDQFKVDHPEWYYPHVHLDMAAGWPMIYCKFYNTSNNVLQLDRDQLELLELYRDKFRSIKRADTFTIDFHKWGYTPCTSSLFICRDRSWIQLLERSETNYSYFGENDNVLDYERQHHLTIETSRPAIPVYTSFANTYCLGIKGRIALTSHCLSLAQTFRAELIERVAQAVIVTNNKGPTVCFTLYDVDTREQAERLHQLCLYDSSLMESHNDFKRLVHSRRFGRSVAPQGLMSSFPLSALVTIETNQQYHSAEKLAFYNPLTTVDQMIQFLDCLNQTIFDLRNGK